ncbi:hypothetical protein NIIDMKKI_16900 [Mycobacterium kansasii]|uniref:MalK-like OB fold domain-containing protein n=1 Tax=Mycobacterium kansasii TaxID=1768 RepID=A0A7G1I7R4_MYCKA|nr:hypothetical protein NIIDMKKI_16900 [Mycobacterium kansasii]
MGRAIVRHPKAFLMDEPLSNLDAKLRVQMRGEIARLQKRLGTTTVYVTHDQTEAMTLGDRVVVMHGGVAQQIGTPTELYEHPANVFVAGFIGSPTMNFFPATLTSIGLTLPFGEVTLAPEVQQLIAARAKTENIIVGVRPEHLQDAALIDAYQRIKALTFQVGVDLVESLGADKYVYFTTSAPAVHSAQLDELEAQGNARKPVCSKGFRGIEGGYRAVARVSFRHHQTGRFRRRLRCQPDYSRCRVIFGGSACGWRRVCVRGVQRVSRAAESRECRRRLTLGAVGSRWAPSAHAGRRRLTLGAVGSRWAPSEPVPIAETEVKEQADEDHAADHRRVTPPGSSSGMKWKFMP